jgi:hypothetical protein
MSWLLKVTHMWVAFFKLLDEKFLKSEKKSDGRQGEKR